MTNEDAKLWLIDHLNVSRETLARLDNLREATIIANSTQNLVARSTLDLMWVRHIVDSAQLLRFALDKGSWIDLGSGAGFPGLVIAIIADDPVMLIEVRRKRADHLEEMIERLGLHNAAVLRSRTEQAFCPTATFISARAYAPLERLFESAHHLSDKNTIWILPKGRSAASELAAASITWQGDFRIEPSVTDPESAIIVATNVQPRRRR